MNFCFNCGYKLSGGEKFCPNCGTDLSFKNHPSSASHDGKQGESFVSSNIDSSDIDESTHEFTSKILLGGSLLRPDKLLITNTEIIYQKRNRNLIGSDETSIPLSRVSSVKVNRRLIDTEITIFSTGNKEVIVKDFSIKDAKSIKQIIDSRIK